MKTKFSLALDGMSLERAFLRLQQLGNVISIAKVHDLLDALGPMVLKFLTLLGVQPWVDYKLHDTKDTVGLRVSALVKNGAKVITVHASGGVEMMMTAVASTMSGCDERVAKIYAITVLTSLDDKQILEIYNRDRLAQVEVLARMALGAGVDGIVCSALELEHLRSLPEFADVHLVVPGTRSKGAKLGQQKRSDTPGNAVANGADELVVGSQVTKADDPEIAMRKFVRQVVRGEARRQA